MVCRPDIDKLLRLLPPKSSRQTVLFSATFPANTKELCDFALKPNPIVVDCVGEDTEQTAKRVSQWTQSSVSLLPSLLVMFLSSVFGMPPGRMSVLDVSLLSAQVLAEDHILICTKVCSQRRPWPRKDGCPLATNKDLLRQKQAPCLVLLCGPCHMLIYTSIRCHEFGEPSSVPWHSWISWSIKAQS